MFARLTGKSEKGQPLPGRVNLFSRSGSASGGLAPAAPGSEAAAAHATAETVATVSSQPAHVATSETIELTYPSTFVYDTTFNAAVERASGLPEPVRSAPALAVTAAASPPSATTVDAPKTPITRADEAYSPADVSPASSRRLLSDPTVAPSRLAKFQRLFEARTIDIEALRQLSWSGIPRQFRIFAWQLLLVRRFFWFRILGNFLRSLVYKRSRLSRGNPHRVTVLHTTSFDITA